MAIAVDMTYTVSGMDTYHKACAHTGFPGREHPAPGILFHWVEAVEGGFVVHEVWESEDQFAEFLEEHSRRCRWRSARRSLRRTCAESRATHVRLNRSSVVDDLVAVVSPTQSDSGREPGEQAADSGRDDLTCCSRAVHLTGGSRHRPRLQLRAGAGEDLEVRRPCHRVG